MSRKRPLAQLDIESVSSKSDFDYSSISSDDRSWSSAVSMTPKPNSSPRARRTSTLHYQTPNQPSTPDSDSSKSESIQSVLVSVQSELSALSELIARLTHGDNDMQTALKSLQTQQDSIRSLANSIMLQEQSSQDFTPLVTQPPEDCDKSNEDILFISHADPDDDSTSLSQDVTPTRDASSTETSNHTQHSASSVNINNLNDFLNQELQYNSMDTISTKSDGDSRLFLQNRNGIKVFQDHDPEYLPSIETIKAYEADIVCLPETNVPWHRNDLFL